MVTGRHIKVKTNLNLKSSCALGASEGMIEVLPVLKAPWRSIHAYFNLPILLALSSISGTIGRSALLRLTAYSGNPNGGIIWANFTGCFLMGLVNSSDFQLFSDITGNDRAIENQEDVIYSKRSMNMTRYRLFDSKSSVPLFTAITTGFCGSLTSFSSLIALIFLSSANLGTVGINGLHSITNGNPPNPAYGIMSGLSVLIIQFTVSLAGEAGGEHLSILIYGDKSDPEPSRVSKFLRFSRKGYSITEGILLIFSISVYIVMIVLSATVPTSRLWTFQAIFAPIGTYLRYYLSKNLNNKSAKYPFFGTFLANISGTILISVLLLLQRGKTSDSPLAPSLVQSVISCQILDGLINGFCGCLTTVSTFFSEILKTVRKETKKNLVHGYCYGFGTIILAYCLMVLILGSFTWSRGGLNNPVCYMSNSTTQ